MLPLLERKIPADGPRPQDYSEGAPDIRNLIVTLNDTAVIVYTEQDGRCTMHTGLCLKREKGNDAKVLMNNSNMEFSSGMTDGSILGNYRAVISCQDANAEPFGMKGQALTEEDSRESLLIILSGPYYLASYT